MNGEMGWKTWRDVDLLMVPTKKAEKLIGFSLCQSGVRGYFSSITSEHLWLTLWLTHMLWSLENAELYACFIRALLRNTFHI